MIHRHSSAKALFGRSPARRKNRPLSPFEKALDYTLLQVSHLKNKRQFDALRYGSQQYSLTGFDDLQCIFVHIPKVAGISINSILFENLGGAHRSVRAYKRIFGPATFRKYFKFTFVRNPYSRLLSAFRFLKKGGLNDADRTWAEQNLSGFGSFSEFVRDWLTCESIYSQIHFRPQYEFVCDRSYDPEVDFIGRYETIDLDFAYVCKQLNIERKLHQLNRGPGRRNDWATVYTDEEFEKVFQIYRRDFELFDYSVGPG